MKQSVLRIAVVIMALSLSCLQAAALTLYVSPNGNDAWSGTLPAPNADGKNGPFATLERARDEIRKIKQSGKLPADGIAVALRGGRYFRDQVLALEEQDSGTEASPITYLACDTEKPVLTGCKTIRGFRRVTDPAILKRIPVEARGHVLETELPSQGITDFGKIGLRTSQRPQAGINLFFDGKPMTLARWPNSGFARLAGAPKGKKGGAFAYKDDRAARWVNEPDGRGCGYWAHDWAASNVAFERIDTEQRTIFTKAPHSNYGYRKGGRYYAYNLLCELDQPGEWYLERSTGKLYFWPPSDLATATVEVSIGPGFLSMKDVSFVAFRHITFEGCRGEAVTIRDGKCVQLIGCTLRNLGTRAISIAKGEGHRVVGCDFYDINEGGIHIVGGDRMTLTPCGHVVENCVFTRLARWQRTYVPAVQLYTVGVRIAHNLMYDIPHSQILFSGNDNIIEYNEVHSMGYEGGEMGAFYCGRNWTLSGNIIRYNYLHDIYNPCPQRNRAFMLDDGAAGISMIGNLIVRVAEGISLSSLNNVIDNNVFVDCHPAVGCWGGSASFPPFDINSGHNKTRWPRLEELDLEHPPWSAKFPEMLPLREAIQTGGPVPPECRTRITHNVVYRGMDEWTGFHMTKDKSAWVIDDNFAHQDPGFVDPDNDDYRFRPDSPALKAGIKALPIDRMGLYKSLDRASWPVHHEVRQDVCRNFVYKRPPPPPRPVVPPIQAPRLTSTPAIDGTLAENEWPMKPAPVEQDAGGDTVFSPSQVWLGWDDEALYVAFKNPVNGTNPMELGSTWGKCEAAEIAVKRMTDKSAPTLVLRGYAGGSFESSAEAKANAEAVAKAAEGVTFAAKPIGAALWTCEWRIPFASLGIDPAKETRFRANFTVRKVADNLWVMWVGTTGFSWEVDRAGIIELVK